jgi:hypothetical protein
VALKGTLKDFGIAEILQLIGQQAKSGVLHLESPDDEIHIAMADGSVVRAESAGRKAKEKLGTLLVRAEIIGQQELEYALDIQKRTLRRLGYAKDTMTGHGFRAMARTILDEVLQAKPELIEHQLAHAPRDPLGRAYNRTAHLEERRQMMQTWSDYLDGLKRGATVIPMRRKA